jgi:predicted aminopeptidase
MIMKTLSLFLFFIFVSLSQWGCGNLLYLSKLGWHQSSMAFHSVPVQEVLENEWVDDGAKEKIRFIQEVKRYGEEKLGLILTKNYSKYVEVKGPVLHVLTASRKDCLQLYYWDFPIIGKVTYKSFFTNRDALRGKTFLEEKGYDTFVQSADAYSTLGWLRDPILSSMLEWDEATLANLILHEMTHATVFFKGQTDFNEQMATFIGKKGAIAFLIDKHGKGSKLVVEATLDQEDEFLFSQWVDQACRQLSHFYSKEISKDEKIKGREEVFCIIKKEFTKIPFKTDCYKNFKNKDLNNAVLLAYRRYVHRLDKFEALYEYLGSDLRRMIGFFKEIRASKEDPSAFLERWIEEKGISVPVSLQ